MAKTMATAPRAACATPPSPSCTYVVPTGSTWTDFHATAGQKLLVGYSMEKNDDDDDDDKNACTAGLAAKLGCVSVDPSPK